MSIRALADEVGKAQPPFDRATLTKIEAADAKVRELNWRKVEQTLDALEHEMSSEAEDLAERQPAVAATFEFTATIAALGVNYTAKGRPEDAELITEQVTKAVAKAMREARAQSE